MLSVDIIILEYSFVHEGQEECSIITRRGVQASSLSHGCTCYTCFDLGLQPSAPPPGFDLRLQPLGFTIRLRPYRSHVMHVLSRDSHPRSLRTSLFDQCPGLVRPGSHAHNNTPARAGLAGRTSKLWRQPCWCNYYPHTEVGSPFPCSVQRKQVS